MTKDQFLTVRWNNMLTVLIGLPGVLLALLVLSTSTLSDTAGFIALFLFGVVY